MANQTIEKPSRRSLFISLSLRLPLALLSTGQIDLAYSAEQAPVQATSQRLPALRISIGEQRLLHFEKIHQYTIGSESVIHAKRLEKSDHLMIKGISVGKTDLWVWTEPNLVKMRSVIVNPLRYPSQNSRRSSNQTGQDESLDSVNLPESLLAETESLQEIEVTYGKSTLLLTGELNTEEEAKKIATLKLAFPSMIDDQTTVSSKLARIGKNKLENWLADSKNPYQLKVTVTDQRLKIEGDVLKSDSKKTLEKTVHQLVPWCDIDFDSPPDRAPTVHLKATILELETHAFKKIGSQLSQTSPIQAQIFSQVSLSPAEFDLWLSTIEADGQAKVLSKPDLVLRVPGEAELFSGGELPILKKNHVSSDIEWKPFGLQLKVKMQSESGSYLRLDIQGEVSSLAPEISSTENTPGIKTNRFHSQVDAKYGVPLLLSGLLQNRSHSLNQGIPWFRKIPLIGAFFGTDEEKSENTEIVAILLIEKNLPHVRPDSVRVRSDLTEAAARESETAAPTLSPGRLWIERKAIIQ